MSALATGAWAPAFALPRLGGGIVEFPKSSLVPAATLLVFFKSSCPTCRWALPFFERLHQGAGAALTVVGIAEDAPGEALAFVTDAGLTFPVAIEAEPWPVSAAYGLTTVPTFVLTDASGHVRAVSEGFSRDDLFDVAREASARLGGAPFSPFPDDADIPAFRPG